MVEMSHAVVDPRTVLDVRDGFNWTGIVSFPNILLTFLVLLLSTIIVLWWRLYLHGHILGHTSCTHCNDVLAQALGVGLVV